MSLITDLVIWVHISIGVVAVGAGLGALTTRKGGHRHRRFGRAYVYGVSLVAGSGIILASLHWSPFLLLVSVFSFYLAFSGYRVLSQKRNGQPTAIDWAAASLTLATGFAIAGFVLLGYQGWLVSSTTLPKFFPVILGVSIAYFPITDMWAFRTPSSESQQWFFSHLVRMATSYFVTIATVSITNFDFLPLAVRPFWPAIIGVPLIIIWLRRYRRQLPGVVE